MAAGFSYIESMIHKPPENSLRDFYVNRFGKKLYSMFFEHYIEKLWEQHLCEIAQHVKGVSILVVVKNALEKQFGWKGRKVETSLIEEFSYPKLRPGEL